MDLKVFLLVTVFLVVATNLSDAKPPYRELAKRVLTEVRELERSVEKRRVGRKGKARGDGNTSHGGSELNSDEEKEQSNPNSKEGENNPSKVKSDDKTSGVKEEGGISGKKSEDVEGKKEKEDSKEENSNSIEGAGSPLNQMRDGKDEGGLSGRKSGGKSGAENIKGLFNEQLANLEENMVERDLMTAHLLETLGIGILKSVCEIKNQAREEMENIQVNIESMAEKKDSLIEINRARRSAESLSEKLEKETEMKFTLMDKICFMIQRKSEAVKTAKESFSGRD